MDKLKNNIKLFPAIVASGFILLATTLAATGIVPFSNFVNLFLILLSGFAFIYLIIHLFRNKPALPEPEKNPGQFSGKFTSQQTAGWFDAFMRNSPAVAWIKDSEGRYTFVNEEFCAKFQLDEQSVKGKTDYDILNHEVVDIITQDDKYIVESGSKMEIYEDVPAPDGGMRHWWVHKFPIFGISGDIYTAGLGFDITDKKNGEEALAISERRYRLISENTSDLICLHSPDGAYIYVSPSVKELLGYEPDELIGKLPYDYYGEYEKDKTSAPDKGLPEPAINSTHRFRKKDGQYIWLETSMKPIYDQENNIIQFQSVSRDVSLRKSAEEEISRYMLNLEEMNKELTEAKEIAERSVKIKEEFLASTSHEIRTPMNAIIGLARLMLDSPLNPEHREYLEAIAKSGDTLLIVLNDILDLSKIEAGKMTFEEVNFSLRENIRYTIDLLKSKALEKNIYLKYNIEDTVPETIAGDPVRLNQVLMNMLSNAIKFTHHGGVALTVSVTDPADEYIGLSFTVKDTGIGISHDKLDAIFNSFTQGAKNTTRHYGGSGLGLAIVKKLIEMQGGTIKVDSILNEGSVFTACIRYRRVNHEQETMSHKSSALFKKRGLLVEDNAINQLVASKVLKEFGMDVDIAGNGNEAISKLQTNDYDIVLMDLVMPEMDGYETTEFIRHKMSPKTSLIPIIAMTANPVNGHMQNTPEAGINEYISKPFDTKNLFNKIVKLISNTMTTDGTGNAPNEMERITNLTYLRNLAEGSDSFIEEILTMFIDVIPRSLAELDEYLQRRDWENMKLVAHKIKPSYGFVGVKAAEELMQRIEKNVSEMPDNMLLTELLNHARELSSRCVIELKEELAHMDQNK